ncbi:MAG: TraR/DksA C4-type zinc finger protein [Gemmataceae bacterium]
MWTADELKRVRDQITAQLRELVQSHAGLTAEAVQSPSGTAEDQPAHRAGEEAAFGVLAEEEQLEGELTDAVARIDQGRYGVCERCGKGIAKERLQTLPYARFCVPCARAE